MSAFALLNVLLPHAISLYKMLRSQNPDQPAMTDEFIIDLLRSDAQAVMDKANAWNLAHPPSAPVDPVN